MMRMPGWLQRSLITRLFVLSLCVVATAVVLRWVVLSKALRENLTSAEYVKLEAVAQMAASDVDARVLQRRDLLHRVALELGREDLRDTAALRRRLVDRQAVAPLFNAGLAVYSAGGQEQWASSDVEGGLRIWNEPQLLPTELGTAGAGFVIGRAIRSGDGRGWLAMSSPVLDAHGERRAWVVGVVGLEPEGMLAPVQIHHVGERGGFLLVSPRDRTYVAATSPALRLTSTPPEGMNPLHDRAMTGWRGTGSAVNAQGEEELAAVVSVPSAGWFVVARLPATEAYAPVGAVQLSVWQLGVPGSLLALGSIFWVMWRQFRPLRSSAHRIHRMAQGHEPISALPVTRVDEVGHMVEGFNALVHKLQQSEERLAHLAHHDALTGLPNRMALLESLQQQLALAERQGRQIGLIFVDLDGFKDINDTQGHRAGDAVLRLVAQRLRQGVRRSDIVARLGGDEFVLLVTDLPNEETALSIGAKVVEWIEAPLAPGRTSFLSASVGVAIYPDHGLDADLLMARADAAMYRAKRAGRGRVCLAEANDTRL